MVAILQYACIHLTLVKVFITRTLNKTKQYVGSDRLFCSRMMLTGIITKRIQYYFFKSYNVQTAFSRLYAATFRPKDRAFIKLQVYVYLNKIWR